MRNLPTLEEILKYNNLHVIKRYQKDYPHNTIAAEKAFNELIKYLWLCKKHTQDRKNSPHDDSLNFIMAIHAEMHEIDDMWHTFLLFTKDYAEFCEIYFGDFIHHIPNINNEEISKQAFEIDLTRYLSYVYDNLGEETLKVWFAEHVNA